MQKRDTELWRVCLGVYFLARGLLKPAVTKEEVCEIVLVISTQDEGQGDCELWEAPQ